MSLPMTELPMWIRAKGRGAGVTLPSGKPYVQGVFDSRPEEPGQAYLHERQVRLLQLALERSASVLACLAQNAGVSEDAMFRVPEPGGDASKVHAISLAQILDEANAALAETKGSPAAPAWRNPYSADWGR